MLPGINCSAHSIWFVVVSPNDGFLPGGGGGGGGGGGLVVGALD